MQTLARSLLLLCLALLAACASTSLRDSWVDPAFAGGPFKKWLIVGTGASPVARRTLEDVMSAKLRERGVQAVPGYQFLPDSSYTEAQFDAAVAASGADALMLVNLRGVQTRMQASTQVVPTTGMRMGWWGSVSTWQTVSTVNTFEIAIVETSVYQVSNKQLVWTGSTETFDPSGVAREAPGFSEVIIRALASRSLLPPAR
jgi:hypothetical protein